MLSSPTDKEIREDLYQTNGHVLGQRRLWNIRIAHAIYTLQATVAARKMRTLYNRIMSVLKVEDQVMRSYDRMAGVYNEANQKLRADTRVVLCKHDGQYTRRELGWIHKQELAYFEQSVFRPLIKEGMTILEVGAGETTTIHNLITALAPLKARWSALELSWSRIAEGKRWALEHQTIDHFDDFVVGSALDIPFTDESFNVVFTNACVEQIRYGTRRALSEILRVARRLVVLHEPSYELGDKYQRLYIKGSQYCRGIPAILEAMGVKPTRHELDPHGSNPFNVFAVTIIDKAPKRELRPASLCCPRCKAPLSRIDEGHYCATFACSCVYPTLWGIPCLRKEDGIFASKYREMVGSVSSSHTPHA